jgi:hypothetical protein
VLLIKKVSVEPCEREGGMGKGLERCKEGRDGYTLLTETLNI